MTDILQELCAFYDNVENPHKVYHDQDWQDYSQRKPPAVLVRAKWPDGWNPQPLGTYMLCFPSHPR
jgi:hypothetical protein